MVNTRFFFTVDKGIHIWLELIIYVQDRYKKIEKLLLLIQKTVYYFSLKVKQFIQTFNNLKG